MTKKKTVIFEEGWDDELNLTKEEHEILMWAIKELLDDAEIIQESTPVSELPLEEQEEIYNKINNKNTRH
jgi:hypothetical protein